MSDDKLQDFSLLLPAPLFHARDFESLVGEAPHHVPSMAAAVANAIFRSRLPETCQHIVAVTRRPLKVACTLCQLEFPVRIK